MNVAEPMSSVVPGVPGVILSILARTDRSLTGRSVAGLAGDRASSAGVNRAMRVLVEAGLVLEVPAGRAKLYSLNRRHVAYPAITELAGLRDELFRRIRDAIAQWSSPALSVAVFGSYARGTSVGPASDIDVFIVRPEHTPADDVHWAEQVADLSTSVSDWSGNRCDVLEYDLADLRRLRDEGDPLLASLQHDAVVLHGQSMRSLLQKLEG